MAVFFFKIRKSQRELAQRRGEGRKSHGVYPHPKTQCNNLTASSLRLINSPIVIRDVRQEENLEVKNNAEVNQ
jgi:hypothetical protein